MAYTIIVEALSSDPQVVKIVSFETKFRAYYTENLFLDVFYNEETGRYDFALIYNNDRVLGWDNAPHHKHEFGVLYDSDLEGDMTSDIHKVLTHIKIFIQQHRIGHG